MEEKQGDGDKNNPPNGDKNGGYSHLGKDAAKTSGKNGDTPTTHTIHHEPLNIVVETKQVEDKYAASANENEEESNRIASSANWISILNLLLAIAVFFITYKLFEQTQKSTDAAVKAANTADSTFKDQRTNNRIMRDRDSVKSKNDSISQSNKDKRDSEQFVINIANERKRFKNDSASTQAQIESIKENQKQFEAQTQCYLQLSRFDSISLGKNSSPTYTCRIDNLGAQPAKMVEAYVATFPYAADQDVIRIIREFEKNGEKFSRDIIYVIKEASPIKKIGGLPLTEPELINVRNGTYSIYFFGKFIYINTVTGKRRLYKFAAEVSYGNPINYKFIYSDNLPLN